MWCGTLTLHSTFCDTLLIVERNVKSILNCRFLLFTTHFCDGNVATSKPIYVKFISMLQLYGLKKKPHAIVEGSSKEHNIEKEQKKLYSKKMFWSKNNETKWFQIQVHIHIQVRMHK